ncbi:MAG: CHAT domain-containing protein, partial [Planctomycetota bacterium]|nr:CHAT domain-containing protein [Planctomycetota bacterium]
LLTSTRVAAREAYATNLMGNVYEQLGDPERARALFEEALDLYGKASSVDKADVLGNLGGLHFHLGDDEVALDYYRQAHDLFEKHEDARGMAGALFGMGRVRKLQGGYKTALEIYEQALDLQDDDSAAGMRTRCAMAETYLAMGRPDDALAQIHTALEDTGSGAMRMEHVELLVVHALANLRKKQPQQAIEKIRRALDLLMEVTAGLADEHVVGVREHRGWIFDAGVAVALRTGRVDLAAEFLEHGRAGALLEALGARGAQRGLSADLRESATLAAHRVARAHRAYQEARAARRREDLRRADTELREARAAHRALMQRLQRASKRAASVFHPVPDSLADIRAALGPQDVLVLYALLPFQAHALVVTKAAGGRVVWLGNTPDIRAACESLQAGSAEGETGTADAVEARAARLKQLVLDPLELPAGATRLLLSPDGPLCYVPFPLLLKDADVDVACLPSGTTLRLLAREQARTGKAVLAVGDPQYRIEHQGRSLQVYAEGVPLKPLPATRAEVLAITGPGDMRLLGSYATVRGVAEVAATRPRWRVIHFACHGLIDPRTPTLSSLALTPDGHDDGFLTALEVYGLALPADLVVLSGCNTGRGRFMKGEGLVGLMRAFMCAGTPRVIVSLWKVDDEATRALMTAFHRLWRTEGLPTATALRRAQAEIRAVPAWRHPRFWGAWVLWGLVD